MKNIDQKKNWAVVLVGMIVCLLVRLIPFRAPNVEPILATQMPFSKAYGGFAGFFFGFLSIVIYDIVTGTVGVWTVITASAYGVVGLGAAWFFKNRVATRKNFVIFSLVSTIFYDALTGLSIGPLFFHQSFMSALVGQVPFTLLHVVGNGMFALLISPVIYTFLVNHQRLKIEKMQMAYQIINQS